MASLMKRERIERLKKLFDDAWGVMEDEWNFGEFKTRIEEDSKEAQQIFAELLKEAKD
jgi:hypothetical protein